MKKLLILIVGLFWGLITTAQSQAQLNYSEKKTKNQQQTSSAAMRGCRSNLPKLQVLAPEDQVAVMASERTFLLNISDLPSSPLKLSVLEPYVAETLWEKELMPKESGLLQVSIPETINLKPNQDYIFTATIPCDPNIAGSHIYVRVLFQKKSFHYQVKNLEVKVTRLLDEGIWYDALWIAYQNRLPEFQQLLEMHNIELEE